MSPIAFGDIVQCRTCHGTGVSRNPMWGDKDLARQRQRDRRHRQDVERPTELVPCIECNGGGLHASGRGGRAPRGPRSAESGLGHRGPSTVMVTGRAG